MAAPGARRDLAISAYCVVAIVIAGASMVYGFGRYQEVLADPPRDAHIDWGGARVMLEGGNPYSPEGLAAIGLDEARGLGHPPTTLVWFLPLATLPEQRFKGVWDELTLVALMWMIGMAVYELRLPAPPATAAMLFGLVLATSWMRDHLAVAQVSTMVALLYTIAWLLLRRGRDAGAGVALGLAATLKFYPMVVIVLLLACRRVRVAVAAAVAWVAVAAPVTLWLGLSAWTRFLAQTRYYTDHWTADIRNASVTGIVQRLRFPTCGSRPDTPHAVSWEVSLLATLAALALMALALSVGRRAARDAKTIDLPMSLFVALSIVCGPYTWEHYNVTLVVPLLVAGATAARLWRGGLPRAATLGAAAAIAVIALLLAIDIYDKDDVWRRVAGEPVLHARLHLLEACNALPPYFTFALLAALTMTADRRGLPSEPQPRGEARAAQ